MKSFNTFFYWSLWAVQATLILLLFDAKMHVGGDDSDYVMSAHAFLMGNAFPLWHGSFYPIFLSLIMIFAGFNVVIFKVVSVILTLINFWIFYVTFKNKVAPPALFFALAVTAFSYYLAFFGSTTYSEPLFVFLQSVTFYFFFKCDESGTLKGYKLVLTWLIFGLCMFLLSITRNIGLGVIISVAGYFLLTKKYRFAGISTAMFVTYHAFFILYKKIVWNISEAGFEGQVGKMRLKNFYDPSSGTEDSLGMLVRFYDNSNLYLSKHLSVMLGFRPLEALTIRPVSTFIFYFIFCLIFYLAFRNKAILSVCIYLAVMISMTFISQQAHWDQYRLIVVYLPMIALCFGFLLNELFSWGGFLKYGFRAMLFIIPALVAIQSFASKKNLATSWKNLSNESNQYEGYPGGWKSYAEISEWAGENLSDTATILCRKPGLSGVYGKREFRGIYSFPYKHPDSAVAFIDRNKISYVILDNLHLTAVPHLLSCYLERKPLGLKVVKTGAGSEPSFVLQICKTPPLNDKDFLARAIAGIYVAPKSPYFYFLTGDKYFEQQKYKNAINFFSLGLSYDSTNYNMMARRGIAYFHLSDYKNAIREFEFLTKAIPAEKRYWKVLGDMYGYAGETRKAKEAYMRLK